MKKFQLAKHQGLVCFASLFLLGFIIRLFFLNHSIGDDEAMVLSYYILHHSSPFEILTYPYRLAIQPFSAFSVNAMKFFFSDSLPILRLPSFILGLIAFPFLYQFTKRQFGQKEALLAIFILVFSFSHIVFSTEARGYSGMITFTVILLFITMQLVEKNSLFLWVAFVIFMIINLYNHLSTLNLFAVVSFFLFVTFLKDYFAQNRSWGDTAFRLVILFLSSCIVLSVALFLYSFQGVNFSEAILSKILSLKPANVVVREPLQFEVFATALQTVSHLNYSFFYSMVTDFSLGNRFPSIVQFFLFCTGVCVAWKKNFNATLLLILTIAIPLILEELFKAFAYPKYFSYFLIPYWVFMAIAGFFLLSFIKSKGKGTLPKLIANTVYIGFMCLFFWCYVPLNLWFSPALTAEIYTRNVNTYVDNKNATEYIKTNIKKKDIILNLSYIALPPDGGVTKYYLKDYYPDHSLRNLFTAGARGEKLKKIRVWYIGNIENDKAGMYFFPDNFKPKEVKRFKGINVYLDDNVYFWANSLTEDIERSSPFWLFLKGWYWGQRGKFQYAIKYLDKFVQIRDVPNIRRGYNNLALMWLGLGKQDLALKYFNDALSSDPTLDSKAHPGEYSAPLFNLGVLLGRQAVKDGLVVDKIKYKEGIETIQKGFAFFKDHPNRDMLIDALNSKIIDFNEISFITNSMVNPVLF